MKKRLSIYLTVLIVCALAFADPGNVYGAQSSGKSAKVSLSRSSVSLKAGSSATVRLKNAGSKVKWSVGNKKLIKIRKIKGKHKASVVIRAGNTAGVTYLRAKCGGRTYKCRITIRSAKKPGQEERTIEKRELSGTATDLAAGLERDVSVIEAIRTAAADPGDKFVRAVSNFSFELLHRTIEADTAEARKNVLISPDSVLTALAMLENGAAGDTLTEMQRVMAAGMSVADFNKNIAGLNDRLSASKDIVFSRANSIWARAGAIDVKPGFVRKNKDYHDAAYYSAPFSNATATDMNSWVYNNSRNMIDGIIDRLGPEDRMVLINTIAFEGKWQEPFTASYDGTFRAAGGGSQTVKMLGDTDSYDYMELKGGKGFAKYYNGREIAFAGFVPPEGVDAEQYAASISGSDFIGAWSSRENRRVSIRIPEFKYDYSVSVAKALKQMGMSKVFTGDADLTAMYTPSAGTASLYVDDVLHKTHIELDKNGTSAAAATAIIAKAGSVPIDKAIEVHLDRPFVYALVDTTTGVSLFLGIVNSCE